MNGNSEEEDSDEDCEDESAKDNGHTEDNVNGAAKSMLKHVVYQQKPIIFQANPTPLFA